MIEEDIEVAIKVVVVGNGGVGKSSMIQRFCKGVFTKDYKKTIGVDFLEKQMEYVLVYMLHIIVMWSLIVLVQSFNTVATLRL